MPDRRAGDLKLAVREYVRKRGKDAPPHLAVCLQLIPLGGETHLTPRLRAFFLGLAGAPRYYWVSALYTLLMPQKRRQQLAAYFTPPHLCQYLIRALIAHGFDLERDFVWNRSEDRLRNGPSSQPGEVPLIWAHDVRADAEIQPSAGPRSSRPAADSHSWVTIDPESPALFRQRVNAQATVAVIIVQVSKLAQQCVQNGTRPCPA